MTFKLVGLVHAISHNSKETCCFNLSLDTVSSILYGRKSDMHSYSRKLLWCRVTHFLTDLVLKQIEELGKSLLSFEHYLHPANVICREIGIYVLETINPGGKKAFILSIELCQRWDNRFYLGMIDMRNKGVENTSKIQPIKSDPLKENKGDLSLTDISWSMKIV